MIKVLELEIDHKIPDFEIMNSNKRLITTKGDIIGKNTIIYFYPRDFTPGCTTEATEFTTNYDKFKNNDIQIFGISKDDIKSHKKFSEKMKIPYELLSDVDKQVSKKFDVWGKKKFMGKEYEGILRTTFLIDKKGVVFKIFKNVKPKNHANEVLNAFESILKTK